MLARQATQTVKIRQKRVVTVIFVKTKYMKILLLLTFSMLLHFTYAQNQKPCDERLIAVHGDKAVSLSENNPEYYQFLVFELDNSYYILNADQYDAGQKGEILDISNVMDNNDQPFDIGVLDDLTTFNIHLYNFKRIQNERVAYDLGDGRYLIFYSLEEVKLSYGK